MITIERTGPVYYESALWSASCDACGLGSPYFVTALEVVAWVRGHLTTAHAEPRHAPRRTRGTR